MRKKGYGHASAYGGEPGDLIIVFKVLPHKIFKRDLFDLYVDLPLSYATCVLGGKVKIPLIDETFEYNIPEGTQSGKIFFVRGKGIKTNRGTGDLYIEILVEVPARLSRAQRKALEDFEKETEIKQCPEMRAYKDKIQSMYGENPYSE